MQQFLCVSDKSNSPDNGESEALTRSRSSFIIHSRCSGFRTPETGENTGQHMRSGSTVPTQSRPGPRCWNCTATSPRRAVLDTRLTLTDEGTCPSQPCRARNGGDYSRSGRLVADWLLHIYQRAHCRRLAMGGDHIRPRDPLPERGATRKLSARPSDWYRQRLCEQ
jgi:hypothetical protein